MSQYILHRRLPPDKFDQLCSLWENIASRLNSSERFFVSEENLTENRQRLRLLTSKQFSALLLGEQLAEDTLYQVSIAVDAQGVKELIEEIKLKIPTFSNRLNKVKIPAQTNNAFLMSQFTLELLGVLTPETQDVAYPRFLNNNLRADEILRNQIEQERILNQVTLQINQNLDCLAIIKTTIDQVQMLLKVDRLVVYQLDVEILSEKTGEKQLVDMVTYEAKAYDEIPSILYFRDETCFSGMAELKDKYRQGFSLVVDELEKAPNLSPCLKILMKQLKIKAKLVSPILVQGNLWGFLIAHQCFTPRRWKPSTIQFLEQVAGYLAIAIYQAQSYQQLQRQKKVLETQINQRAKELKEALLSAQIAHQSKTEFLDNMSHELRTPLTCIIGLSRTLSYWSEQTGSLPKEKQKQYLQTIEESGKDLLNLVNEIIDFARIESGKTVLNIKRIGLSPIAKKALQNVKIQAEKQDIALKTDLLIDRKDDYFWADPERLEQILYHLLDNGIKFSKPQGEVILRVWRENNKAVFQVEDTGIGISQQQLPLLFEKFQQLEHSRQRTHGGAGLGLALTKQLVELHGGSIEVESIPDKGSLFTVKLPNHNKSKLSNNGNNKEAVKNHKGLLILLTKEEETATFIYELLTAANYQLIWLIDSMTAVPQIELLEPQIVIIDQQLPEAAEISTTVKQATTEIKIMMLANKMNIQDWELVSSKIVDKCLVKPLHPTELLENIEILRKC